MVPIMLSKHFGNVENHYFPLFIVGRIEVQINKITSPRSYSLSEIKFIVLIPKLLLQPLSNASTAALMLYKWHRNEGKLSF